MCRISGVLGGGCGGAVRNTMGPLSGGLGCEGGSKGAFQTNKQHMEKLVKEYEEVGSMG